MITRELAERAERLRAEREPFVHATVVRAVSPTSVRPGDAAIVLRDGTIEGFVGGACTQASVRLHAIHALETGEGVLLRLEPGTTPQAPVEAGVVVEHNPCLSGGALDIFLDPQLPALRVVIAGDTPIAHSLEDIARAAGYNVVRDDAGAVEPRASDAALVVAAHGNDEEAPLTAALRAGVGYVALVASSKRGAAVLASLDVDQGLRERVHSPAGLAIGARTPAEIAIAILGELVAARVAGPPVEADGASGGSPRAPAVAPGIAIDPVCGMEVLAVEASIHLDVDGERVYFCCDGCRATFVERRAGDVAAR
ncbi:MAG TPA: XdhC family protein [Solirubrobacteraceae bacterium]|nr:XdhC family protein [Solirubrobacteraceae bacterium]